MHNFSLFFFTVVVTVPTLAISTLQRLCCTPMSPGSTWVSCKPRSRRPKRPSTSIQQSTVVNCRH
eukprot:7200221-Pyramimonas_sp.AAC.1